MLRRLSRRLSYANVMATLGVFIALGGSAYAVNTVNSSDIVDGQVKSVDIGDGEVKSADVKDESLTTFDVSTFIGADVVDHTLTERDVAIQGLTGSNVVNDSLLGTQINEATLAFGNTLTSSDLGTNSVRTDEVADGSLTGKDIAESTFNFQGDIGTVDAHTCLSPSVTGVGGQGDHLLLTPNWNTASSQLSYGAEYRSDTSTVALKVCNPTNGPVNDGLTTFNLLVISAN